MFEFKSIIYVFEYLMYSKFDELSYFIFVSIMLSCLKISPKCHNKCQGTWNDCNYENGIAPFSIGLLARDTILSTEVWIQLIENELVKNQQAKCTACHEDTQDFTEMLLTIVFMSYLTCKYKWTSWEEGYDDYWYE